MSIPASHRPAREWLWLVVALVVVAALAAPFWETFAGAKAREDWAKWDENRVVRLLIGPEQIRATFALSGPPSYCKVVTGKCFGSAGRSGSTFCPRKKAPASCRKTPDSLARKVEQVTAGRPFILANMIRLGLGKFAISKSATDVGEVVRNQADVELSRLVTGMSTVNYLAWAIPAIGFVGTVRGLGGAFGANSPNIQIFTDQAKDQLKIAFDCTLVALLLSLVVMYFIHALQRAEETLVTDAQQYCQEHLLLRLYDPAHEAHA